MRLALSLVAPCWYSGHTQGNENQISQAASELSATFDHQPALLDPVMDVQGGTQAPVHFPVARLKSHKSRALDMEHDAPLHDGLFLHRELCRPRKGPSAIITVDLAGCCSLSDQQPHM